MISYKKLITIEDVCNEKLFPSLQDKVRLYYFNSSHVFFLDKNDFNENTNFEEFISNYYTVRGKYSAYSYAVTYNDSILESKLLSNHKRKFKTIEKMIALAKPYGGR